MSKKFRPEQRQALIQNYRQALAQGKSLDDVLASWENSNSLHQSIDSQNTHYQKNNFWKEKAPFLVSTIIGLVLIAIAVGPMLSFFWQNKIMSIAKASQKMIVPIPEGEILNSNNSNQNQTPNSDSIPIMIDEQLDYANLANWFASSSDINSELSAIETTESLDDQKAQLPYTLSIEKLGIANANVKIGGLNLNDSLIQYQTTPRPGSFGTTVIFGHSTLRQWYNPAESNPERYKSIFSTIMTLSVGDHIQIQTNDQIYTYEVITKKNVKPENIEALLAQDASDKYLRLITCTPEGTTLMRGLIESVLIDTTAL